MKTVYISILTYNGNSDTLECLESLNKLLVSDCQLNIFVVDNNSTKPFEIPSSLDLNYQVEVIKNTENKGFSGGHNVVLKKAIEQNIDYVLILNNDTTVGENFLNELIKGADLDKKIGVAVPKIYFAKGSEYHKKYKSSELGKVFWYAGGIMDWSNVIGSHRGVDEVDYGQYDNAEETDFATGCCMLVKIAALKNVGFFDERYFLYYEDTDLQQRIKKAGYKIMYIPKAVIWHKNAGSVGGSGSPLQDYFITRNRLLLGISYAPIRAKIALIRESFKILLNGRKYQKKGIIDYYAGKLGKGTYFNE